VDRVFHGEPPVPLTHTGLRECYEMPPEDGEVRFVLSVDTAFFDQF
jgi:hypothetical protein